MSKDGQEQSRASAEKPFSTEAPPDNPAPSSNKTAVDENLSEPNSQAKDGKDDHEYPGALTLSAIMTAVYLAMFLVALVN